MPSTHFWPHTYPMELKLPTLDDIRRAYHEGEEATIALFMQVIAQVSQLAALGEQQADAIRALEAKLGKDSHTSSKPPSSDGYGKAPVDGNRTESQRKAGQKPNGGQPGHEGKTLERTAHPDHTETHAPNTCQQCGVSLEGIEASGGEERQVFGHPVSEAIVTAHRVLHVAATCGSLNKGVFPDGANAPVQYGQGIRALGSLLNCGHHIPLARTTEILEDLFGHPVSEALVAGSVQALAEAVKPAEEAIKSQLADGGILHADESGMRVVGKLHWLHVAATDPTRRATQATRTHPPKPTAQPAAQAGRFQTRSAGLHGRLPRTVRQQPSRTRRAHGQGQTEGVGRLQDNWRG